MASTYTPIATTTLGSATSSYTFSSIPSTYTDLILIATAGNSVGANYSGTIQFNGDTGTNYSYTEVYTNASTAYSYRSSNGSNIFCIRTNATLTAAPAIIQIQNYSNATTYKTVLARAGTTDTIEMVAGLWGSTSAINSIKILSEAPTNFITGSTFTLYGIAAA
jgi:hypothetical protein